MLKKYFHFRIPLYDLKVVKNNDIFEIIFIFLLKFFCYGNTYRYRTEIRVNNLRGNINWALKQIKVAL